MTNDNNKKHGGGPKTPEGKARSSMNATRHGFAARGICIFTDSKEEFAKYRQNYIETFNPANFLELELLDEMVFAKWQIMRSQALYTAALDNCMFTHREKLLKQCADLSNTDITAQCARILHETDSFARNADRYQARYHRIYQRYLTLLIELQKDRINNRGPKFEPDITHKEESNETNLLAHAWDHVPFERRPKYVREAAQAKLQNELPAAAVTLTAPVAAIDVTRRNPLPANSEAEKFLTALLSPDYGIRPSGKLQNELAVPPKPKAKAA